MVGLIPPKALDSDTVPANDVTVLPLMSADLILMLKAAQLHHLQELYHNPTL